MPMVQIDDSRPVPLLGHSPAIEALRRSAERVARANIPVLIHGENGTGKEVLSRLIHDQSPWRGGPFVPVNCPAIPGSLLESELFGHEKGSFTGAESARPGWVEVARGGTLFLDEIAELEMGLQPKLLQLLQDGTYFRIGGREEKRADVRVICATNRRLEEEVQANRFRSDLYYRINAIELCMPPLRERRMDILEFVHYFLDLYTQMYGRTPRPLSGRLLHILVMHDWPGNVRQLENVIRQYVVMNSEDVIVQGLQRRDGAVVPGRPERSAGAPGLKELTRNAVLECEREMVAQVLQANNWNCRKAARVLGISYRALFYKIKAFRLERAERAQALALVASGADLK